MTVNHILVIGGTGMLKGVSQHYASQGHHVSVVARPQSDKLGNLAKHPNILPVEVDYSNYDLLRELLQKNADQYGMYQTVVSWIHGYAQEAHQVIAEVTPSCEYFHLLGSSNIQALQKCMQANLFEEFPSLQYYRVVLGHIREGNGHRWLTHSEISEGVIQAVAEKKSTYIIGTIE